MGVFFDNEDFLELLLYGGGILFALIVLVILAQVLKAGINARVRNTSTPFGMGIDDVNKLHKEGRLTDEEMKAVREAMARQLVERTRAEQAVKSLPSKAEVALKIAEEQVASAPPAAKPAPRPADPPAAKPEPLDPAAARLAALAGKTDYELEQLRESGFLSEEEFVSAKQLRANDEGEIV
jgi:hypothetical protein